jgi:hypothetical protein
MSLITFYANQIWLASATASSNPRIVKPAAPLALHRARQTDAESQQQRGLPLFNGVI